MFNIGDTIGSYRIVRPLGKGGMGEVYEVEHLRLGTHYALKAFSLAHGDVELLRERFVAEGKVLARLNHPNLVRVFELDSDPKTGTLYFVMDLVRAAATGPGSFVDLEATPAEERDLARWFGQLCAALDYIHGRGIVHRDIKPSNILVDGTGDVRLVDFGVSRYVGAAVRRELLFPAWKVDGAWQSGTMNLKMGTGGFMAPEVAAGRPATAASDAYSLGLVFFHLLTGVWYEPKRNMLRFLDPLEGHWRDVLEPLLKPSPEDRPGLLTELGTKVFPATEGASATGAPSRRLRLGRLVKGACVALSLTCIGLVLWFHRVREAPHPDSIQIGLPCRESLVLVRCEPGEFMMGSPANEQGRFANETLHRVRLTKGFWIADRETTQGQWKSIMGGQTVVDLARLALHSPEADTLGAGNVEAQMTSGMEKRWMLPKNTDPVTRCGDLNDDYPVYYVTWEQATNFCARLTQLARKSGGLPPGYEYRLPTEAEWEYACRAGSTTSLPGTVRCTSAG